MDYFAVGNADPLVRIMIVQSVYATAGSTVEDPYRLFFFSYPGNVDLDSRLYSYPFNVGSILKM